jgi:exodeoxyribonuclease VIII
MARNHGNMGGKMNLSPGIYQNISFEDYNALPHIRNSYLKKLIQCPAAAQIKEDKDTPALAIGRAGHCFILEGDNAFHSDFCVLPSDAPKKPTDRQIFAAKPSPETVHAVAYWNMFAAQSKGKQIVTLEDYNTLAGMKESIKNHPFASLLLADCQSEQTVIFNYTTANGTVIPCKARPDSTPSPKLRCLIDLKTTEDPGYDAFMRSCYKYNYWQQSAFYLDAYNAVRGDLPEVDAFCFIVVSKKPPYQVECYTVMGDNNLLIRGRASYQSALEIEAECRFNNHWPAYLNAGAQELISFSDR